MNRYLFHIAIFFIFKLKPNKRKQVDSYKKSIRDLRAFGREIILERIEEVKKKEEISNDMLSIIIKNSG